MKIWDTLKWAWEKVKGCCWRERSVAPQGATGSAASQGKWKTSAEARKFSVKARKALSRQRARQSNT